MQNRIQRFQDWLGSVLHIPWIRALATVRERFQEDRLGLTASSLTFTTVIALVPLMTVILAVFTAFPIFSKFQTVLQQWFMDSLIPENIASQVLDYLNQFAKKASRLGIVGLAALLTSALVLILTIDRTLNTIWRVRKVRPLGQRLLIYWACISLGPMLLALIVSMSSYVASVSSGIVTALPGGFILLIDPLQVLLVATAMATMFCFVPNTHVRWGHAWIGGLLVAIGLELAKRILGFYISRVPTYSLIYGAFATLPILLIWIYAVWLIVLFGATLTAHLPSLLAKDVQRATPQGWQMEVALEVLRHLHEARSQEAIKGLTLDQLCTALRLDPLRLEPVLESLAGMDWIGQLHEIIEMGRETSNPADDARYILLINPATTPLAPLIRRWLVSDTPATEKLWQKGLWSTASLHEVL
ncbi:MAG: hypothetical protein RIR79_1047 [Pseudomonadota bacterium]|jgi:membrane protein